MSWRPEGWEYSKAIIGDWDNVTSAKKWDIPHSFGWRDGYEAGADAILEALKKEGKYIDATEYSYGVVLNEVPPIQKLTRDFKGWVIIIKEGG